MYVLNKSLDKSFKRIENGVLEWYIDFRPNVNVTGNNVWLEDTLRPGISLRTFSDGQLNTDNGNFVISETKYNEKGDITSSTPIINLQ